MSDQVTSEDMQRMDELLGFGIKQDTRNKYLAAIRRFKTWALERFPQMIWERKSTT